MTGKRCSSASAQDAGDLVAACPRARPPRAARAAAAWRPSSRRRGRARSSARAPARPARAARRGGATWARGYHRAPMTGGWRIEAYGRSVRGAELRVHLPPRPAPPARRGAARRGARDGAAGARRARPRRRRPTPRCAIVLCANPDGVADGTRQNARGVDLNRNFPAASWREGTTRSYPVGIDPAERVPANRTNVSSTGAAPLSEPESAALAAPDRAPRARRWCSTCTRRSSSC